MRGKPPSFSFTGCWGCGKGRRCLPGASRGQLASRGIQGAVAPQRTWDTGTVSCTSASRPLSGRGSALTPGSSCRLFAWSLFQAQDSRPHASVSPSALAWPQADGVRGQKSDYMAALPRPGSFPGKDSWLIKCFHSSSWDSPGETMVTPRDVMFPELRGMRSESCWGHGAPGSGLDVRATRPSPVPSPGPGPTWHSHAPPKCPTW